MTPSTLLAARNKPLLTPAEIRAAQRPLEDFCTRCGEMIDALTIGSDECWECAALDGVHPPRARLRPLSHAQKEANAVAEEMRLTRRAKGGTVGAELLARHLAAQERVWNEGARPPSAE